MMLLLLLRLCLLLRRYCRVIQQKKKIEKNDNKENQYLDDKSIYYVWKCIAFAVMEDKRFILR